jgi:hypothetical protein
MSINEDNEHELALNDDGPTQAIAFLKIKNMTNLVKQCRGASQ